MTHRISVLNEVAESGKFDLVIYGHTHRKDIHKIGNTLVINPGEATDWLTDESNVVILELDDMKCEIISLI